MAAAAAEGGCTHAATTPLQLEQQGERQAVAAHTDGVAEGDGAAVHVGDLGRNAKVGHGRDTNRGEGLVQLEQVDITRRLSDLGERVVDSLARLLQQTDVVGARHLTV